MSKIKQFQDDLKWNPMKDDYNNAAFNNYSIGPGTALNSRAGSVPCLVIKNLPPQLKMKALQNLCTEFGEVSTIRNSTKNSFIFVQLVSVADMEAVYRGLQNNSFGFSVEIERSKRRKPPIETANTSEQACTRVALPCQIVDIDLYRTFGQQPQHPHFVKPPIVTEKDYMENPLLLRNDPQRYFLIEHDAHDLERAGFKVPPSNNSIQGSNYEYRTGRAFIRMQDKDKKWLANRYLPAESAIFKGNELGQCAECQSDCDIVCTRCGIFYCSIDCQKKAWPEHRYTCPKIVDTTSAFSEESTTRLPTKSIYDTLTPTDINNSADLKMPLSGTKVLMTAFSKSNLVFIRSIEDNTLFFRVISQIHAAAKKLSRAKTSVTCGEIVAAEFENQFNRAMVLKADDWKRIKIIFIDYGNMEVKAIEELYELPESFIRLPRICRPVILKYVPDVLMTEEVRKLMIFYVGTASFRVKYKEKEDFVTEKGIYRVKLIDDSSNKNLNYAILTACTPAEPPVSRKCYYDFLRQNALPSGENIDLVVLDNSMLNIGYLSCTTKELCFEIQGIQETIENYGQSLKPQNYAPRVDELCIAKYSEDNKWYRGRCLNVSGNGRPVIAFFDYGNIAPVPVEDIRPYSPTFTYPIYTCDCVIEGLSPPCDDSLVEKLMELIPNGSTIVCDTVKLLDRERCYSIALRSVLKELKKLNCSQLPD